MKYFLALVALIFGSLLLATWFVPKPEAVLILSATDSLRIKPVFQKYIPLVPEPEFKNLNMIGYVDSLGVRGERLRGMVLRAMRFKNISRWVEQKYDLPENMVLAMIMHESGGIDLLPNRRDDGGIGLCHMQPVTAVFFGLRTFKNCNELRCQEHGKELRAIIERFQNEKRILIDFDDRFHPILNLDAVGRMLAYYKVKNIEKEIPIENAILHYAGKIKFEEYYQRVELYRSVLNSPDSIQAVRARFNELNPDLLVNGSPGNFDIYIAACQKLNFNYGFNEYKKLK